MLSAIKLFKKVQKAPEGEDVLGFCNDLKDIGDESKDKKHPIYYWDESKKEFVKDNIYFSGTLSNKFYYRNKILNFLATYEKIFFRIRYIPENYKILN